MSALDDLRELEAARDKYAAWRLRNPGGFWLKRTTDPCALQLPMMDMDPVLTDLLRENARAFHGLIEQLVDREHRRLRLLARAEAARTLAEIPVEEDAFSHAKIAESVASEAGEGKYG
jgi:hypothetical protein